MLEFRLPFQLAQCVVVALGLLQAATPDAVIVSATEAAAYRRIKAEAIDDVALMTVYCWCLLLVYCCASEEDRVPTNLQDASVRHRVKISDERVKDTRKFSPIVRCTYSSSELHLPELDSSPLFLHLLHSLRMPLKASAERMQSQSLCRFRG